MNLTNDHAVHVVDLRRQFRRVVAVDSLSTTWTAGIHGVLGPNGAGKSTLLRMVAALDSPTSGDVWIFGSRSTATPQKLRGAIGYLPQSPGTPRQLSPRNLVAYSAHLRGIPRTDIETETDRALSEVEASEFADRPLGTLSGGQRQRSSIAAAIVGSPRLVVLDEPTSGLDPEQRVKFRHLLRDLGERSVVLMSTHLVEDIQLGCDTVMVMNHGHAVFDGALSDLHDIGLQSADNGDAVTALEAGYLALMHSP